MDFHPALPLTARGYSCLLVVICRLSKMIHLIATKNEATAQAIALLFIQRIFTLHGQPVEIVSDRDGRFTSPFWQEVFRLLKTDLKIATSHHHETDGQTERTIRTVEQYLRS